MSLDSFRVRKGLIVDGGSTTTGSATVNGSLILTGSTSGQINVTAPAVAGSQAYTLPTALPAVNNYVLTGQTDGTLGWAAGSSVTTTYTIDAASTTGGANFNLTGSDAGVDTIKFASGGATTVTATDANTITVSSTDTNTTYTQDASATTSGANLNLVGSDSTTDTIKFANGTNVTVTATDANTITIAATDTNTTYTQDASSTTGGANLNLVGSDSTTDTIKFANGTNVTVTATDANTITIAATDTNTTYDISSSSVTGGANLNLNGSDSTTDSVKFASAGATTVTSTDANTVTIFSVNTTYTQDASSTTGGANLNMVGSDSTTDSVKFASGTNVTVTATDANTITIASTDTNTTYTVDASATTGGANFNLVGSDSTTDTIKFASGGATTVNQTDANTITVSSVNTTYTQDASATTGGANLNLVGSDSTTDSIKFAGGTNVTVTATDANTITLSSTDTNTTYTISSSSTTGGANLNLVGSDSTTDSVKYANGTGVTVTSPDANTVSIAIGQDVATTANVTFASVTTPTLKAADGTTALTLANTTGDVTANRYIQVNGNRILSSSGTPAFYFDTSGNAATNGYFTIFGNIIRSWNGSAGATAITLSNTNNGDITVAGDITVGGSDIKAADGTTALTLASSTGAVTTGGALTVGGNSIKASDGTTALTIAPTTGDVTTQANLTIGSNVIKAADGTTALTLSNTTGAVKSNGNLTVGGNTINAADGTNAITLSSTSGNTTILSDLLYNSRILGSASKTIRTGPNRTTSYASISGAGPEDILTMGIGASGVPISGILTTNSGLATGSTAGRRQGVLIRNYGGNEYNGNMTTPPQGAFMSESSRGTYADPRSLANGNPLAIVQGYSNAGSDLASGNTPYWTAEQYPVAPVYGLVASQIHKGPFGAGAGVTVFTATIAASSTSLVVSSVSLGTILIGQEIRLSSGANWATTTNSFQIIAQVSGTTGGAGTYTLNANPGTYTSPTVMWSVSTTLGANFIVNNQPQNTPLTTTSRVQQVISADGIIFRAQSANTGANIFSVNSWPTTVFAGTGTGTSAGNFVQGSNKTYLGITDTTTTVGNTLAVSGTMKTTLTALNIQNSANTNMISVSSANTIFNTDNIEFRDSAGNLVTSDKLDYNRTYGEFAYTNATGFGIAAQNTIYAMPLDTTNYSSGVNVSSTSHVNITTPGTYKLIMSLQAAMSTNTVGQFDFWLRKNGTDVTNSKTQVDLLKDQKSVIAMDWMVSSNGTDYWEIVYASSSANYADITFPTIAATASPYVSPLAPALILNVIPVGA